MREVPISRKRHCSDNFISDIAIVKSSILKISLSISWAHGITADLKENKCDGGRKMPDELKRVEMESIDLCLNPPSKFEELIGFIE